MAAGFVLGRWTILPGNHVLSFSFSWPPGQNPNKGPVFCMLSPDHPANREDVKLTSQTVSARLMGVYFPEFQTDWKI